VNSLRAYFVNSIKSLLLYHEGIGIAGYRKSDDIKSFVNTAAQSVEKTTHSSTAFSRRRRVPGEKPQAAARSEVTPAEIADEVAVCRACELHKKRIYPVAGRGGDKVRLLIAGDWLVSDANGNLEPGHLFGVEQDIMLSRMLAAINLPPENVFVTNVIKCALHYNEQPQAAHVESCVSFLRRQVIALMPEVICTMGMIAARALLEQRQPLSRLRGKFHNYEVAEKIAIPLLTTYHPTYLLQNPEMKQATWADLQLLGKRLGLKEKTS
jgi:DNA polymerase